MKKRLFSLLLTVVMLLSTVSAILPLHVHAGGYKCGWCDTYYPEDEDVLVCFNCYVCENCADICEECMACYLCATELGFHCEECNESCVDEAYGNVPHCVSCLKCEFCVELKETSDGLMCEECIKENAENDGNTMCEHCGINVIYNDEEGEDDDCAPCGVHCITCYEEFYCPECDDCTLCTGEELCETCGICAQCAYDNGYHCQYCGECYAAVGQCRDGGDHCTNCCEDICENCGTCTLGADIEFCETCERCEDCREHCEVCEECMEEVGQCESGGNHCRECCIAEGWICEQCERCTEALELAVCEYCGLCEECCKKNSEYYGVSKCILDDETKPEDLDTSKHDKNHHIVVYECVDDGTHAGHCIFPGCDFKVTVQPHNFVSRTLENATVEKTGRKENTCVQCGYQEVRTIPKLNPPEYCFIEQPKDIEILPNQKYATFYVKVGIVGSDESINWSYVRIAAIPIIDNANLPASVSELYGNVYQDDIKEMHYWEYDMIFDKTTGSYPCRLFGTAGCVWESFAIVESRFKGFQAQGQKLTWRFVIYDIRGGKLTYSEPFTINWNAKHNKHTNECVCRELTPYMAKLYSAFIDTTSPTAQYFADGTCHWMECTTCHAMTSFPSNHHYEAVGLVGNCVKAYRRYVCKECGHILDKQVSGAEIGHTYSDKYYYDDTYHWQHCTIKGCGYVEGKKEVGKTGHVIENQVFRNCEKTITVTYCKICGYTHMERTDGTGHKYSNDGPFKGWYGNSTYHWKVCTECGYIKKEAHSFHDGHCTVCGENSHQMIIVGDMCQHGVLHIERSDDMEDKQKAQFDAGRYGVTWIDEDTGNTVGMGKTYELGPGDEGRSFRAEVTFMDTDGWEWWEKDMTAYMEGHVIATSYKTVTGYAATCASEGLKDHKVCTSCGKKFINNKEVSDVTIPKTGHIYDNSCDAICNVCGYTREASHKWSGKYTYSSDGHRLECAVCGTLSPIVPHVLTSILVNGGDCEHEGTYKYQCECGYGYEENVAATGHKWVHVEAVEALCICTGFAEHYYCEYCYVMATDNEGKNRVGIKKLETPFDTNNHIGGEAVGYNAEQHYTICQCGAHIEAAAHTFNESGRCTVCGYKKDSVGGTAVSNLTKHERIEATCVSEGIKAYYTDAKGNAYLSPAGVKIVPQNQLVIPVNPENHAGHDENDFAVTDRHHSKLGFDAYRHFIICECYTQLSSTEHEFGGNDICSVCGYKQGDIIADTVPVTPPDSTSDAAPDTAPETSPNQGTGEIIEGKSGFPFWIVFVIAAAIVIIVIVIAAVSSKKKR